MTATIDPVSTASYAITRARAMTPEGMVNDCTVVVDDGVIVDIVTSGSAPPDSVDAHGLLLLPGLVDTHSDGLEKERSPRRSVEFPIDFALRSFEGRLRSAGITTVFHGVSFEDKPRYGRSVGIAEAMCAEIDARRRVREVAVDHRVLFRTEARNPLGVAPARPWIERFSAPGVAPLVSFEDHTPGQGQFRDVDQYKATMDPAALPAGETVESSLARIVAEAEAALVHRDRNRATLAELARAGEVRLLAHDCEDAGDVAEAVGAGAAMAEFPLSVDAARAAKDAGLTVVMGAPNALRGGSHSGNVAARALIEAGLCDVLASDYQPTSLLAAAFLLAREGSCPLVDAVALCTSGPARAAGLADRGRIEPGARADLVLVDDSERWPAVVQVRRAGTTAW